MRITVKIVLKVSSIKEMGSVCLSVYTPHQMVLQFVVGLRKLLTLVLGILYSPSTRDTS